jgi:hypothetical protein
VSLIGGLFSAQPELRIARSQIPSVKTPGCTDSASTFSAPPNHRLIVWLEWWKDGKMTVTINAPPAWHRRAGKNSRRG